MAIMVFTLILPNVTLAGGPTDTTYCPRCHGGGKVVLYENGQFDSSHTCDYHEATCEHPAYITCTQCPGKGGVGPCDHAFDVTIEGEPALGHDFSVLKEEVPSTCSTPGYRLWGCSHTGCNCTATYKEPLPTNPNNHEDVRTDYGYPATCAESGLTDATYCEACDTTIVKHEIIPALDPVWGQPYIDPYATCTSSGVKYTDCINCDGKVEGHRLAEIIYPLGHDIAHTEAYLFDHKDATCAEEGSNVYKCSRCNYTEPDTIKKLEPEWGEWYVTTEPNCTKGGFKVRLCKNCQGGVIGHSEIGQIDPLGHDIAHTDEYLIAHIEPTCTEDGESVWQCSRCNYTEKETIEKLGHDYKLRDVVYPTCIAEGYEYWECSHDSTHNFKVPIAIDPDDGHQPVPMEDVDPWCTDEGYTGGIICQLCKKVIEEPTELDPLGHIWGKPVLKNFSDTGAQFTVTCERDSSHMYYLYTPWSHVPATKETCCVSGNIEYYKFYDEEGAFAKDSYVYIYNVENQSGYYTYTLTTDLHEILIDPYGPQWGDNWEVTKEPTCTEPGERTRTCTECGGAILSHIQTEVIPALGLQWGDWFVTKDPTCFTEGEETRVCIHCRGEEKGHIETRPIEMVEHTVVIDKAVDPTCSETGLTEGSHCSECNKVIKAQEEISKLEPKWGEWIVTKPTCTEDGVKTRVCVNCEGKVEGHSQTAIIPATGHKWEETGHTYTDTDDKQHTIDTDYECVNEGCDATKTESELEDHHFSPTGLEARVTEGDTTTHTWWFIEECDDCGHVHEFIAEWEGKEVESHNKELIKHEDADCVNDGYDKYKCKDCGYTWKEVIESSGIIWSDWKVTKEMKPHVTDGEETRVCTVCKGEVAGHTETRKIDAGEHEWEEYIKLHQDPTCTEDGFDDYYKKCDCGLDEFVRREIIPALGHKPGEPVIENRVEPTHTESGSYDEVIYCDRCDEELSRETKSIDPVGHDWKEYVKEHKDPTCTEDGYDIIHKNCDCGEDEYVRTDIIPATGHTWGDNYEVVIKEATEDEDGLIEIRHNCVVCGTVEVVGYKAIPKIGSLAPVQTGDNNNTALFVTMGGAAICLIVACLILLNRRRAK